jgi:hypothetical protein
LSLSWRPVGPLARSWTILDGRSLVVPVRKVGVFGREHWRMPFRSNANVRYHELIAGVNRK